jgi:hypothetical protein
MSALSGQVDLAHVPSMHATYRQWLLGLVLTHSELGNKTLSIRLYTLVVSPFIARLYTLQSEHKVSCSFILAKTQTEIVEQDLGRVDSQLLRCRPGIEYFPNLAGEFSLNEWHLKKEYTVFDDALFGDDI